MPRSKSVPRPSSSTNAAASAPAGPASWLCETALVAAGVLVEILSPLIVRSRFALDFGHGRKRRPVDLLRPAAIEVGDPKLVASDLPAEIVHDRLRVVF